MDQERSLDLIRRLLRAPDEATLMQIVGQSLPMLDSAYFETAEAAAQELEREGKPSQALALRRLTGTMLRMKTLI